MNHRQIVEADTRQHLQNFLADLVEVEDPHAEDRRTLERIAHTLRNPEITAPTIRGQIREINRIWTSLNRYTKKARILKACSSLLQIALAKNGL
jgi:muramidase (phage lysozyme)